ncbi:E3 ubiquitin-protein ligase RNF12 isoform X1 [Brassica rapa]|uniref:E3 ubiquitin-protein ligase RNF12 isoform X1 n=1 Tax=Brassica campestris TaxID=3711 RepID=UPI00142DD62F|nr:E3 ubiquitin-protein ligase RNF12 isoform X1 [Brassica rapa]
MAKLFGYPINVKAEEEDDDGGSSIAAEFYRSGNQPDYEAIRETNPYIRFLESISDPGSVSMESEPDRHHSFIDFFGRESYVGSNQRLSTSRAFDIWGIQDMEEEEVELGLRIGSGSGSDHSGELGLQVTRSFEIDTRMIEIGSSRVEIGSGRVEIGSGRVEINTGRVGNNTGRVEIGTGLVEIGTGLVEIGTGLVEIGTGLVEIGTGIAFVGDDILVGHVEPQNEITWVVPEPVEPQEEVGGVSLSQEPMEEYNQEWHGGLFDGFFEESVDLVMEDFFDTLFPDIDVYAANNRDYEDVIARTFHESGTKGSPPASKRMVDELPDVGITSEELSIGCAICKDEIVVEEKVKRLPCRHYYHKECIVPWLGIRNTCPVCRYELPTDDLEYERNKRSRRGLGRDLMSE